MMHRPAEMPFAGNEGVNSRMSLSLWKVSLPEKLMAQTESMARELASRNPEATEAVNRISAPRLDSIAS